MTSLVINSADYSTGKAQQTTITGVNPKVGTETLQTFAQMTAALSKDTYVKAERVDKANLDAQKPARTIAVLASRTLGGTTGIANIPGDDLELKLTLDDTRAYDIEIRLPIGFEQGVLPYFSDISIEGDGLSTENSGWARTFYYADFYQTEGLRGMWNLTIRLAKTIACTVTATINIPETDQYAAYSRTLTWTISAKE